jgi:hypothetical protein
LIKKPLAVNIIQQVSDVLSSNVENISPNPIVPVSTQPQEAAQPFDAATDAVNQNISGLIESVANIGHVPQIAVVNNVLLENVQCELSTQDFEVKTAPKPKKASRKKAKKTSYNVKPNVQPQNEEGVISSLGEVQHIVATAEYANQLDENIHPNVIAEPMDIDENIPDIFIGGGLNDVLDFPPMLDLCVNNDLISLKDIENLLGNFLLISLKLQSHTCYFIFCYKYFFSFSLLIFLLFYDSLLIFLFFSFFSFLLSFLFCFLSSTL